MSYFQTFASSLNMDSIKSYWNTQSTTRKSMAVAATLALAYCTSRLYSKRSEIVQNVFTNLPEVIRVNILKQLGGSGTIMNATIYPYALWMVYRINDDKIEELQRYLPSGLTITKHKILASDKEEHYYLCYNIYMAEFSNLENLRLEINVVAKNEKNNKCWVVLDVYTDIIRFDSVTPIYPPNCKKKYFNVRSVDDDEKNGKRKEIEIGIYIDNQEKKHDLFDFKVEIDLNDKALNADSVWVDACEFMYGGCEDRRMVDEYGWITEAKFDAKEHDHYLNAEVKQNVNNLFTGIRGEFATCFVIPNQQKYELKIL